MKYLIPADVTAKPATRHEQNSNRIRWYPWLGLTLVLSTAAATYGALALFLFD